MTEALSPEVTTELTVKHSDLTKTFNHKLRANFENSQGKTLFTTQVEPLFKIFLDNLPADRQHYDCNCCRSFFKRFGNLVTLEDGKVKSVWWNNNNFPMFFQRSIDELNEKVEKAPISGVFISDRKVWGKPETDGWSHYYFEPPESYVYNAAITSVKEAKATKVQNHNNVVRALRKYGIAQINTAEQLLLAKSVDRSEKFIAPLRFLKDLKIATENAKSRIQRNNIIWEAVGSAPDGFCHISTGVIGTFISDLAKGFDNKTAAKRFNYKVAPTNFQRAKVAPAAGNIKAAEDLVEKLGIKNSLKRRYARFDEIKTFWTPKTKVEVKKEGGVFDSIIPKGRVQPEFPLIELQPHTWVKFVDKVLPLALEIDLILIPNRIYAQHETYLTTQTAMPGVAFVTAEDMDAPPIILWDLPENRNPVSWYFKNPSLPPSSWNLKEKNRVIGISDLPCNWNGCTTHGLPPANILILEDSHDKSPYTGIGLFNEMLRSELHGIRSVTEAYSNSNTLADKDKSVCGLAIPTVVFRPFRLCVTTENSRNLVTIDRWD